MPQVTMKGNPLNLSGNAVGPGEQAPDFTAVTTDLKPAHLSDFKGKPVVLVAVPSLDTSVCDLETRRFDKEAAKLSPDVKILVISMDLPFAQKRWCGAAEAKHITPLSDHRNADFGRKYGVLIDDLRLLARSVFVVDRSGKVTYKQIVPEVTHEPNYDEVLEAIKSVS